MCPAAFIILLMKIGCTKYTAGSGAFLRRSDHAPFWEAGIPAMNFTDTANLRYAAYHCADGEDVIDNLNHQFATKIIQTAVFSAAIALNN